MPARNRLAVDIGGTFTDLVLSMPDRTVSTKLLTTHDAPDRAVIEGTRQILTEAGLDGSALDLIVHGTTLATNALIERKGARTALITTAGFRDSLEIAYEHRFDQYDLYMERPTPLAERDLRLEVTERMAADGSVLLPLDEPGLLALVNCLRAERIQAVAISFLHAYVNPAHEQRAREVLSAAMPDLAITLSSEVCREIREYERTSTTVANAYVLPLMANYLSRMKDGFAVIGVRCPLLLMMSSGGICTVETACRFPVRLVESGPAGGVILARRIAALGGYDRALSFDMGGTTAKITLIDDFSPQQSRHFEVARAYRFIKGSGIPVRIPVIDMVEIGAGGGSIGRVDSLRRIAVGPDSAGSNPGPACYGRGGVSPTVTDADLMLGRLDPSRFAGGKIVLDPGPAHDAVLSGIGSVLHMPAEESARGIVEIVDENMASAARVHAVENGKDTAGRTLIAFGGAAPLHAARLAHKLGISRVVIPVDAGVGSAHGFLDAPISYEVARTFLIRLNALDADAIEDLFRSMRAEAEAVVRLGVPTGPLTETRTAYMRYRGQGHEIAVTLDVASPTVMVREGAPSTSLFASTTKDVGDRPSPAMTGVDGGALLQAFETTYARLFGRVIPKLEVEAVTWTLSLSQPYTLPSVASPVIDRQPATPIGTRTMVEAAGGTVSASVYARPSLRPGDTLSGPAAIVEDGTTTIVPTGFTAQIASGGEIVIHGATP